MHAFMAAWYRGSRTPSCCAPGNLLALLGSGNLGTPFERMQRANASSWEACDAAPRLDELLLETEPVGLLPQADKNTVRLIRTAAAIGGETERFHRALRPTPARP